MSASVTEAAQANAELDPKSGHIYVRGAEGQATMKAGRWNPVSSDRISSILHSLIILVGAAKGSDRGRRGT